MNAAIRSAALLALALGASGCAGLRGAASVPPLPIIDMHMHARLANHYGPAPPPMCAPVVAMPLWDPAEPIGTGLDFAGRVPCEQPIHAAASDEAVFAETLAVMERRNIVGVLGGEPDLVADWMARAPGRFYAGLDFRLDRAGGTASVAASGEAYVPPSPEDLRALHAAGRLQVFAEILNQYGGILPDDPRMTPYWALAEELDIPVGIHLVQALVDAGYGDRIMFGSDQMVWPGLIEPGIESIERAPFLSAAGKRAILYDNAARFLRLDAAEIARHHGR